MDEATRAERKDRFKEFIIERYNNRHLYGFIDELSIEEFFGNKTNKTYSWDNGVTIPADMKVVKAFKFLEHDKVWLDEIQQEASRIIQEDVIEGTLCISVHPLDFLSSSENTHNWRSCHALDGDYAGGNLSYMIDNSTVICYLKSSKDVVLPHFPFAWNNKKWRVLLFFSDLWDMVFAGRQYPFNSDVIIDFVKRHMFEMCGFTSYWTGWRGGIMREWVEPRSNRHYTTAPLVPIGDEMVSLQKLVPNQHRSLNFNDLTDSSCYSPIYAYNTRESYWGPVLAGSTSRERTKFHIGGEPLCTCCGRDRVVNSALLICNDCELQYGDRNDDDYGYCECCDAHVLRDDGVYVDDYFYCSDCFNRHFVWCESCNSYIFKEQARWNYVKEKYFCNECIDFYNMILEEFEDYGDNKE